MTTEPKGLRARIDRLSFKKQLAYALLMIERMVPCLKAFSKDTGFDGSSYLEARQIAWAVLQKGQDERSPRQLYLHDPPDTEQYSHQLTSAALNAALAFGEILAFLRDGGVKHIWTIKTLADDTVDLYVGALEPTLVSSKEDDRRIAEHSLTRREILSQSADLDFVSDLPDRMDTQTLSKIRDRAAATRPILPIKSTGSTLESESSKTE